MRGLNLKEAVELILEGHHIERYFDAMDQEHPIVDHNGNCVSTHTPRGARITIWRCPRSVYYDGIKIEPRNVPACI